MLSRLEIRDFALIDFTFFDLNEGLTVLTGETGAGKSIIIDAIGAVTGNRVNKDMIRGGCEFATITAYFDIDNFDYLKPFYDEYNIPCEDNTLIISREIYQNGKTYARFNGKSIPISTLKDLTKNLLDIHGQHENQAIFKQDIQLDLLDRFGGEKILGSITRFQEQIKPYQDCIHKLQEFVFDEAQKEQMIDMLEYQIKEIKAIHPKVNEDTELMARRKIVSNVEKIKKVLEESNYYLNGDVQVPALVGISKARNLIEHQLSNYDDYKSIAENLNEIESMLEDVCDNIRIEIEKVMIEPGELESIDARLDQLFRLKKKYGATITDVLEFYKNAVNKLQTIRSSEERVAELLKKKEIFYNNLKVAAQEIFNERKYASEILEKKICEQLSLLGMKGTKFSVNITHIENPTQISKNGFDNVDFLISPNIGEELKPLSRIASGGEASRIMLAIKTILADSDEIPLLIFDEVDTGISGKTAGLLGQKLLDISQNHQVLCVTHMAQIAAKAKQHIFIEKNVANNETKTKLIYLDKQGRVDEIARLLSGGENHEKALELANDMLNQNQFTW